MHINSKINSIINVTNIMYVSFNLLLLLTLKVNIKHIDEITVNINICIVLPGMLTDLDINNFASCISIILAVIIHTNPEIKIIVVTDIISISSSILFIFKFPILFILLPL